MCFNGPTNVASSVCLRRFPARRAASEPERRVSAARGRLYARTAIQKQQRESRRASVTPPTDSLAACPPSSLSQRKDGPGLRQDGADQRKRGSALQGDPGGERHPSDGEAEHDKGCADRGDPGTVRAALSFFFFHVRRPSPLSLRICAISLVPPGEVSARVAGRVCLAKLNEGACCALT